MKDVYLSKRMEAVVNMVSPQSFTIADVGCDHAYVSIALLQRGIADKVIAMDVRTGPLEIARKNVKEAGYEGTIDIRLGDGLEQLQPGEADGIIIAGMGGLLMKGILERGVEILSYKAKRPVLVLQPQSDLKEVRIFLLEHAYTIVSETMLQEDGKYYTVMRAEPVDRMLQKAGEEVEPVLQESYGEVGLVYGKCNLIEKNTTLYEYLQKEQKVFKQIRNKVQATIEKAESLGEEIPVTTRERLESVKRELEMNAQALRFYTTEGGVSGEM